MLRSLRLRLLAGFGLVIALSLLFAGVASVLLLRDQQTEMAEQRIGRLVTPLSAYAFEMELIGWPHQRISARLTDFARVFDIRILLVGRDQRVIVDTADPADMLGQSLEIVRHPAMFGPDDEVQPFYSERASTQGQDMYLFTASLPAPLAPAGVLQPQPESTLVIAVPAGDVTAAWAQLLPRFAIAGGMAALFAVVVGTLLAARITRPISDMTAASEAMARGDYSQRITVRGNDEVATLARAFNQMASQVRRSTQAQRQLLADVSHELRTPLTSIQGFSQALVDGLAADPQEQARMGEVVHEEAERMRGLLDDLLYLSRLESGELTLALDEVALDDLVAASVRRMNFRADAAGVSLRHELNAGSITGDGRRLEQVLANLLDNAIRFAPPGSEVSVRSYRNDNEVVVEVHNDGEPIAEEHLPHVFDRFYQADPARGGGHSGLGLAIVSELVQTHGGRVSVESTAEAGTTFTVRLPRSGPGTAASHRAPPGPAQGRTSDGIPET